MTGYFSTYNENYNYKNYYKNTFTAVKNNRRIVLSN